VLEGKYWKRKKDAVAAEYRKWRAYYREKNVSVKPVSFPGFRIRNETKGTRLS
jgi:hypothetical protein